MGDYAFFIKSATFLLLLNFVIFSFPSQVEALTEGRLNTSSIQGTNFTLKNPSFTINDDERLDLTNTVNRSNVEITSEGYLVLENGSNNGYATYNISNFDTNVNGNYEVFFDADSATTFTFDALRLQVDRETSTGVQTFNDTLTSPALLENIADPVITFYFPLESAEVRSVEDSTSFEHTEEKSALRQLAGDLGVAGFTSTLGSLVELYTNPQSGNRFLGMVFTLYLLGFIVFLSKEILPS